MITGIRFVHAWRPMEVKTTDCSRVEALALEQKHNEE